MHILVTYGSKHGGTEGIAQVLGDELRRAGHDVDVRPPRGLEGLEAYDAVVVGGGLYASFWQRDARRFVQRHLDELERMPVWFFSSGPLGEKHQEPDIEPTKGVASLMSKVNARGHVTFGGRLDPDQQGVIARSLAKQGMAGDWRDMASVRAWAREIAATLASTTPAPAGARPAARQRGLRAVVGLLTLFVGVTAIGGGLALMTAPEGSPAFGLPLSVLQHSPFTSFFWPGFLLFTFVGLLNAVAGVVVLRRWRYGEPVAFVGGGSMTVFIVVEMLMLREVHLLHIVYLALGLATLLASAVLWSRRRRAAVRPRLEPSALRRAWA